MSQENAPAVETALTPEEQVARMKRDWDARAAENARYWVATERFEWTDEQWWDSAGRRSAKRSSPT